MQSEPDASKNTSEFSSRELTALAIDFVITISAAFVAACDNLAAIHRRIMTGYEHCIELHERGGVKSSISVP
jgi:hypothetical protein